MNHKTDNHQNAHPFVDGQRGLVSSKNVAERLAPGRREKQAAETGRGLDQKRQHQEKMEQPVYGTKTFNPCVCHRVRHLLGQPVCLRHPGDHCHRVRHSAQYPVWHLVRRRVRHSVYYPQYPV